MWLGDVATSEADFHKAMNFASLFSVPAVLFCVNNQWAISTPLALQSATSTVGTRAAAYIMPALQVDGFDSQACWSATAQALERPRAGASPTLIEAVLYGIGPSATADDPANYRDQTEPERLSNT